MYHDQNKKIGDFRSTISTHSPDIEGIIKYLEGVIDRPAPKRPEEKDNYNKMGPKVIKEIVDRNLSRITTDWIGHKNEFEREHELAHDIIRELIDSQNLSFEGRIKRCLEILDYFGVDYPIKDINKINVDAIKGEIWRIIPRAIQSYEPNK